MEKKDESISYSDFLGELIIVHEIKKEGNSIVFYFNKSCFNVWFENTNKHIPEVYELNEKSTGVFSFSSSCLPKDLAQTSLKLTISDSVDRLDYFIKDECFKSIIIGSFEFFLEREKSNLIIKIKNIIKLNQPEIINSKSLYYANSISSSRFEKVKDKNGPVKVGVIGSCFSRSVFRSDTFFNPNYKKYFTISLTYFHNSLISIMSKSFEDEEYLLAADLLHDSVLRYTEIEFLKNVKEQIRSSGIEYIVFDNYSDSALEVIEMNGKSFLTYNKYFSESIYKRKFSDKKVFFPGEVNHLEKYREAVKKLYFLLQELKLDKKIILVGGRLSLFKTQTELWESKIDWINKTNHNWDLYDAIFLEEIPDAQYINMKKTSWISDVNTPIIGGASPSHYQSGFYKDIYKKILNTIY